MVGKIEQRVTVRLALPFLIRLNDDIYECRLGKNDFLLKLETVSNDIIDNSDKVDDSPQESNILFEPTTGKLTQAIRMNVPGMMLQYSLSTINFCRRISPSYDEETEQIKNLGLSHKFLNYFINIYRFLTQDIDVHALTYKEFTEVRAGQTLHYSTICPQMGILTSGGNFGSGVTMPSQPFGIDEHQNIKKLLSEGRQPPLVNLLLLNSKGFLKDFELRLAVVELGAAIDINSEQIASNIIKKNNLSDKYNLEKMNTKPIFENIIHPYINEDLIHSSPYIKWDNDFRRLRNSVIHDAYEPTMSEAEEAITNVNSLIDYLSKISFK